MQSAVGPPLPHTQGNSLAKASGASLLPSLPLWDEMQQLLRRDGWLAATVVEKAVPGGCSSSSEWQRGLWPRVTRTNIYFYLQTMSECSTCLCGSKQKILPHPKAGEESPKGKGICMTKLLHLLLIRRIEKYRKATIS